MNNNKGSLLAFILGLMLLLAFLPACTWETTLGCNSAALINAINNANSDADVSTIRLYPDCTYILSDVYAIPTSYFGSSVFVYGSVGLPPIITPIIIMGNHATITRADTDSEFRFFFITVEGNLTLNDVTITNGYANESVGGGTGSTSPGSGGAIYNYGAILEINHSTIQENTSEHYGGAIFNDYNATTYINDSIISDNRSSRGGGIAVYGGGLLSIENSTIKKNNSNADGGGIILEHGAELVVKNSILEANRAIWRGGGIFKDGAATRLPTTITGTTFRNNTADQGGGGIFIFRTPLIITESVFFENQSSEYGGGLAYQSDSAETVQITRTTFDSNTAGLGGGGIHFSGVLMTIKTSAFQNNEAENGGAIHNAAVESGSPISGSYIIHDNPKMTIVQSKIQNNAARTRGGGIYNYGLLTVNGSSISNNQSVEGGGGIFNRGEIIAQDSTFSGNTTGTDGGGLLNTSVGSAKVTSSTFVDNTAGRGGGLANIGAEATVVNSTISGNTASDTGGGIFNTVSLEGESSAGGAVFASHITVANNNSPTGGGISTSGGQMKIKNSIVAYSPSGADCFTAGSDLLVDSENLDTDGSCVGFTVMEDPLLAPLADNGGPTYTHALEIASPAVDAAPDCSTLEGVTLLADQRGQPRPSGAYCDLGAYEIDQEFQAATPETLIEPTPTTEPAQVIAIKNANCRYGPSTAYDIADTLFEGQTALILGSNEENTWWQIKGPSFGTLCWVSYVTVDTSGDVNGVPVGVAPPLPEAPPVSPQGCLVYDQYQNIVCAVPCPPNPQPGGACTP